MMRFPTMAVRGACRAGRSQLQLPLRPPCLRSAARAPGAERPATFGVWSLSRRPRAATLDRCPASACGLLRRSSTSASSSAPSSAAEDGEKATEEVSLARSCALLLAGTAAAGAVAAAVLRYRGYRLFVGPQEILEKAVDDVFHRIDMDESGTISLQELHLAVVLLSHELNARIPYFTEAPSEQRIKEALATFDANSDGVLDKAEFKALMMSMLDVADAYFTALMGALLRNVVLLPLVAYGAKFCLMQVSPLRPAVALVPVSVVAPVVGVALTMAKIRTHTPVLLLQQKKRRQLQGQDAAGDAAR